MYPEFAAKSFGTHEAYVDHVLARQQEIHDLVRRNTNQAQLRQKLKYDRVIRARAYQPGELVWVLCRYVPQKGSPKLMRAWRIRFIYGSKKLTTTQAKYGAPKLEMFAAYYFILKNHIYLCPRKFTLRVDNQALSWLKTYSTVQALIGRGIMTLDKYHFRVEHRPRTQHRDADGLSKRTNDYRCREKQLAQLPAAGERWNFLSAEEFDNLPIAPWFDLQGRIIPNHPDLPSAELGA